MADAAPWSEGAAADRADRVHHSESGWTAAVALEDIVDLDDEARAALGPHLPRLTFLLDDLRAQPDDALKSRAMSALGRLVLLCLRDARSSVDLARDLRRWAELVREVLLSPSGRAAFLAVARYLSEVSGLKADELQQIVVAAVGEEVREAMKSTADMLREEGWQKGRQEGRQEGLVEGERAVLRRLLTRRFGELPPSVLARVEAAPLHEIEGWCERILVAKTLAEVFGDA